MLPGKQAELCTGHIRLSNISDSPCCTDVSEVLGASIIRAINALVNFYETTRCNIQEGYNLHTHRLENLKSH
jgi:hypothetical protein